MYLLVQVARRVAQFGQRVGHRVEVQDHIAVAAPGTGP